MGLFTRAVITGFGFSLGAALFKKVSRQLGLDEPPREPTAAQAAGDDAAEAPPTADPAMA